MIAAQNAPISTTPISNDPTTETAAAAAAAQQTINPILHRLYHQWNAVQERLRVEVGDNAYKNWLKPLVPTCW